jgi:hypothetical protein
VSHHECDDEGLRGALDDFLKKGSGWDRVCDQVHYLKGDFTDAKTFKALAGKLGGNVVFYLAEAFRLVDALGDAGLLDEAEGFRRVVIEKPFGTDLSPHRRLIAASSRKRARRRSTGSTISWARRRSRTSWSRGSETPCSNRSGTTATSIMSRSLPPRRSPEEVRAAATHRSRSNEDGGVADAIDRFVLPGMRR